MNDKIKNNGTNIRTSVEVLLGAMAYNSQLPRISRIIESSGTSQVDDIKMIRLPMGKVDYIDTIDKMAYMHPEYNELLMTIGIDLSDDLYGHDLFHAEVVKYLASNDIMFSSDSNQGDWLINFPSEKINNLLESDYHFFLDNSRDFFNHFYNENMMMKLRKTGDEKSRQYMKA